jgi:hypothetical protein
LFRRAAALLPDRDSLRLEILRELMWPLSQAGAFDEIHAAIDELGASEEPRFQAFADAMRLDIEFSTGQYRSDNAYERLDEIRRAVEAIADELGLAWVEFLSFSISWSALRAEEERLVWPLPRARPQRSRAKSRSGRGSLNS